MPSRFSNRNALVQTTGLAMLIAASLAGCNSTPAPHPIGEPAPSASGTTQASAVHVIVSDETGGRIVIIDAANGNIIESVAVGKRPRGLRALRDGSHVFVALSGSPIAGPGVDESKLPPADRSADGVGIVDLATRKVVRTIKSGQDPETFALSPDEGTLYVSNEETAEMTVVNLPNADVAPTRIKACEEPEGVTVRPGGAEVYVTCEGANAVVIINTQTLKPVAQVPVGARPRSIAFTPDGALAFITGENASAVTVLDANAHKVTDTITLKPSASNPMPPRPMGAVLSPDAKTLFVSNGRAKSVAVIDIASKTAQRTFEDVGTRPWGIAVSPDGKTVYTANGPSGDVSFIDVATGTVSRKVAVGGSPWGVIAVQVKQ